MSKELKYGDEAKQLILKGINKVSKAVESTLGPNGKNVVLARKFGSPIITNDGVTIAKEISLKNHYENVGAQLLKEVASKTNDIAGDGTTTATVLASYIFKDGFKNITAGANPIEIKKGIEEAVKVVLAGLSEDSKVIDNQSEIANVATISANNDQEIGGLIAEAMEKVGKDGVITVEDSKGMETSLEVVEGMQFDKGYVSPYMVTDKERMEAVYENPYILVTDKKISTVKDLLPILEKSARESKALVIVADDVDGEALTTLVVNNLRGTVKSLVVRAPGFGDNKKETLEDIAILCGTEVISESKGNSLESINPEFLGSASKITSTKDKTTIIGGSGSTEAITERIDMINSLVKNTESSYEKEKLQTRKGRLSGGIAVLRIGAATETELKEKKYRVEDALAATRAAVEEGIIPGGGMGLIRQIPKLENKMLHYPDSKKDFIVGMDIIKNSLKIPFIRILENSNEDVSITLHNILKEKYEIGYNARTKKIANLFEAGVIDPTKVTKSALLNASSIVGLLLTTDVLIVDLDEEAKESDNEFAMGGLQ